MASLCLPFWFWGDETLIYVSEISSLFLSLLYPFKWYCCRKPNSWRYDSSEKTPFPLSKMWSIFLRHACGMLPSPPPSSWQFWLKLKPPEWQFSAPWLSELLEEVWGHDTHARSSRRTLLQRWGGRQGHGHWTSKDGQRLGEVKLGKSNMGKQRWSMTWTRKKGQRNGQGKMVKDGQVKMGHLSLNMIDTRETPTTSMSKRFAEGGHNQTTATIWNQEIFIMCFSHWSFKPGDRIYPPFWRAP